eukprot:jgi/Mesvir1/2042/Mv19394-RA.1
MEDGTFADVASRTGSYPARCPPRPLLPVCPTAQGSPRYVSTLRTRMSCYSPIWAISIIHALGPADAVVAAPAAHEVAMAAIKLRLTLPKCAVFSPQGDRSGFPAAIPGWGIGAGAWFLVPDVPVGDPD